MAKYKKIMTLSLMIIIFFILGFMVKGSSEGILFDVWIMDYMHTNINPLLLSLISREDNI